MGKCGQGALFSDSWLDTMAGKQREAKGHPTRQYEAKGGSVPCHWAKRAVDWTAELEVELEAMAIRQP